MKLSYYRAHKADYYCREKPYRIFKNRYFWKVQKLDFQPDKDDIIYYANTLVEAKQWLLNKLI